MNKAVNLLQQYISDGQLEKALAECKKLTEANPQEIYLMKLLSHIYFLMERYEKAISTTSKILDKDPVDFDSMNNLGNYYLKLEEFEKTLFYITKAKEINPEHPAPYQNYCEMLMKKREFGNAAENLDKCILLHEKYSNDYLTYKSTLLIRIEIFIALKEQAKAIEFIKKYLSLKFDGELLLNLIQINKEEVSAELINICKEKVLTKSFNSKIERYQELVPLYFALATFYEKDKPDISQEYYVKANKEVSEIQRLSMMKFQKSVGRVTDNYEALNDINITNANKGSNNIFIVGMPRSGTTLTESLITANSEVFGGGELMSFYDLSYKFLIEKDFSMSCCESVGDNYIRRTNYFLTKYKVVADKLPNNYHFIGHIRKFLPSAKIILLLRNPWDLAVSLFKQRYVTNIPFASSFFNIGIQVANFEACVLYWKKIGALDDNVMTIHYEELVKNFDAYQGKIYDFCEITSPYEPKKREKFFAKTASINQVQNKVHTESLKKQDFSILKSEFIDALRSQREFWKYKKIAEIPDDFFGYSIE